MRPVLLAAALVLAPVLVPVLAPVAAHASGTQPATPQPASADASQPGADPCAPVDGEVPLLCQSGPAAGPEQLPVTGGTPYAEGALLLALLGGGAVLVRRRALT